MSKQLKLIWDFHGVDAKGTAEHHAIHLNQFADKEKLSNFSFGTEEISDTHYTAYITVNQDVMPIVRDALIPHRGEWAE